MRDLVAWYADWNRPDGPPPPRKPDETPKPPPPPRPDRTPPKKAHAIVVGRFDPLHRGHLMLIDAARALAARTTIVVRTQPTDAVPAATRLAWCRDLAPTAELACAPPPGDPATLAFWQHWADAIRAVVPDADALVTSDRDAWRLADVLGVAFILIDPDRLAIPISARDLRADPHALWDHLGPAARAHFATRVTILGPEGSGKSTLARALADHLATIHVPEHARTLAERRGTLSLADLACAADTQLALEHALARQCNRILVSDTDARSLALWAERLHGHCPPALAAQAAACRPDLYVLAEPLPLPNADNEARTAFARRCREVAAASGVPWIVAGGSIDQRVATVVSALRARSA
jgi:HTH-type transcriptional regulator, transcriptional repressor of NAD biosynthesis genes